MNYTNILILFEKKNETVQRLLLNILKLYNRVKCSEGPVINRSAVYFTDPSLHSGLLPEVYYKKKSLSVLIRTLSFILIQNDFPHTHTFRSHFHIFIFLDVFQSLF